MEGETCSLDEDGGGEWPRFHVSVMQADECGARCAFVSPLGTWDRTPCSVIEWCLAKAATLLAVVHEVRGTWLGAFVADPYLVRLVHSDNGRIFVELNDDGQALDGGPFTLAALAEAMQRGPAQRMPWTFVAPGTANAVDTGT